VLPARPRTAEPPARHRARPAVTDKCTHSGVGIAMPGATQQFGERPARLCLQYLSDVSHVVPDPGEGVRLAEAARVMPGRAPYSVPLRVLSQPRLASTRSGADSENQPSHSRRSIHIQVYPGRSQPPQVISSRRSAWSPWPDSRIPAPRVTARPRIPGSLAHAMQSLGRFAQVPSRARYAR
jgi:hypothetical protein